jgi:putative tricarboxylic transport membrane protein
MAQMRRSEFIALASSALAASLGARAARAADYPSRPVELVVPASAGGGTDAVARAFAEAAKRHSPQPFVVVNRPGASGAIGMNEVLNARPDGYKVAVVIVELAILPFLNQIRFSADDFRMVARLNADPAAIMVRTDAPWNTIEDFIAEAKRRPDQVKLGDSGVGSIWHLAAAAMAEKAGASFIHAPYPGAAPGLLALLGGHVDAMASSPGEAAAHVQGGKLKVLAVMSDNRAPGFEDVPTLKERGIDLSIGTWRGLGLRKGTPEPVAEALAAIARKVAEEPSFREALARSNLGHAFAEAGAFDAAIARDREAFKQLVARLQLT